MKIEIVKTEKATGEIYFSVYVDDKYVSNSLDSDFKKVEQTFNKVVEFKGAEKQSKVQVIEI